MNRNKHNYCLLFYDVNIIAKGEFVQYILPHKNKPKMGIKITPPSTHHRSNLNTFSGIVRDISACSRRQDHRDPRPQTRWSPGEPFYSYGAGTRDRKYHVQETFWHLYYQHPGAFHTSRQSCYCIVLQLCPRLPSPVVLCIPSSAATLQIHRTGGGTALYHRSPNRYVCVCMWWLDDTTLLPQRRRDGK